MKIKLKASFHNKSEKKKQETELANKEPSIKSKTNWEPKKTIILLKLLSNSQKCC